MIAFVLYESSYRVEVLPLMINRPHTQKMFCANRVINLATGEIYKDRYDGKAGEFLPRAELKELRKKHLHTTVEEVTPKHFEEDLFKL